MTDVKVLDAPMELVKGEVKAVSGVTGQGALFAINQTGDNALITLRYRLKDADIQVAEEPFEAGGAKFNRGTFIIKGVAQADLDKTLTALGLKATALPAAPTVKTHPARAARVAILHQWTNTQTEGWWRQAFDIYGVPFDYIDPETVKKTADLRAKYDVIVFGPGGGQGAVDGQPMWRNPTPWNKKELPNVGAWAQTDDTRIGMGLEGLMHLREFIAKGGVFIGSNSSAEFAIANFAHGVSAGSPASTTRVVGSLLRTKLVDDASPIAYGVVGQPGDVQQQRRRTSPSARARAAAGAGVARLRLRRRRAGQRGQRGGGGRPTGRGTADDPDTVQGRPMYEGSNLTPLPTPQQVQPWQYSLPTDEQLKRNPGNLIPPQFRPRVVLRFDAQNTLLVSGLLDGGADIAQRPGRRGRAGRPGPRGAVREQPDLPGRDDRQLPDGVQRDPELRQPERRAEAGREVGQASRLSLVVASDLVAGGWRGSRDRCPGYGRSPRIRLHPPPSNPATLPTRPPTV